VGLRVRVTRRLAAAMTSASSSWSRPLLGLQSVFVFVSGIVFLEGAYGNNSRRPSRLSSQEFCLPKLHMKTGWWADKQQCVLRIELFQVVCLTCDIMNMEC